MAQCAAIYCLKSVPFNEACTPCSKHVLYMHNTRFPKMTDVHSKHSIIRDELQGRLLKPLFLKIVSFLLQGKKDTIESSHRLILTQCSTAVQLRFKYSHPTVPATSNFSRLKQWLNWAKTETLKSLFQLWFLNVRQGISPRERCRRKRSTIVIRTGFRHVLHVPCTRHKFTRGAKTCQNGWSNNGCHLSFTSQSGNAYRFGVILNARD